MIILFQHSPLRVDRVVFRPFETLRDPIRKPGTCRGSEWNPVEERGKGAKGSVKGDSKNGDTSVRSIDFEETEIAYGDDIRDSRLGFRSSSLLYTHLPFKEDVS